MDLVSLIRSSGFQPHRLVPPDSWVGHIPFAAWLTQTLRPAVLVELGTHSGNSYFSFCQAVKEARLATRCYAVDTWQGDEQAGYYGGEVFEEVNSYNRGRYDAFSRLLRMTFDDALGYFAEESIDLLHIDGLHTYEAVRHDFEFWMPKLAPSAVILFHDTNVRERDFGVWRLWAELSRRYPSNLEFLHSNGLGVLQLSTGDGSFSLDWLDPTKTDQRLLVDFFRARGAEVSRQFELLELKLRLLEFQEAVTIRDEKIADLDQAIAERDGRDKALRQEVARIVDVERKLIDAENKLAELFASNSWRLTAPMRTVRRSLDWVVRNRTVYKKIAARTGTAGLLNPVPWRHALSRGGTSPRPTNQDFDVDFYLSAYPDVAAAGVDPYEHYSNTGREEGRLGSAPMPAVFGDLGLLDVRKATVLIVSHDASRTGAPILALNLAQRLRKRYNIIAMLLGGGELVYDFQSRCDVVIGPFEAGRNPNVVNVTLPKLLINVKLVYAIVNSIESRAVLPALAQLFVPSVALIHEFASYTRPRSAIAETLLWASQVVFSAAIVVENAEAECQALKRRPPLILRQGRTEAPVRVTSAEYCEQHRARVKTLIRPATFPADTVIVLAAGLVQLRKGVDLFLACAARVRDLSPRNPFRFVWAGLGFDPDRDVGYSVYLQDQLTRAGLEGLVAFVGEVAPIDIAYEITDILFLSSRLDPLPNAAIDAMTYEIPVVCFDRTTGIAEALISGGLEEACVASYLDVEGAARRLVRLIDDARMRRGIGKETSRLASRLFDMGTYVEALEGAARRSGDAQMLEKQDCKVIEDGGGLRMDFCPHPDRPHMHLSAAVRWFVRSWASGVDPRKPFPGFHPGMYQDAHPDVGEHRNPLAHFIESGRPEGPWLWEVIGPAQSEAVIPSKARVALHIHAYYSDLMPDIASRLASQSLDLDLLISVPSEQAADDVRLRVESAGLRIGALAVVPNRGRDIGPLLTEFGPLLLERYDLVGHIHTKKSVTVEDEVMGQMWFRFLMENLIGGRHPMASQIISRLGADNRLGLVFPDDPNVIGWTQNRPEAGKLASRLGLSNLPENQFNFPVGTMFWARVKAIAPLLELGLSYDDYPEEPLPYDGTMLHALERLFPSIGLTSGFGLALTNVPGITR